MDLASLWLPIVLSAVVVFIASSIAWMVLPHHKADIKKLPNEAEFTRTLSEMDIPPGTYMWPNCENNAEMKSEEFKQRYEEGPWGNMNIVPRKPNFALNLMLMFVFYLVVSAIVGYLTSQARAPGADFLAVFEFASIGAFAGYCLGGFPHSIFFGRPVRAVFTDFVDGVVHALLTGVVFAWLWPAGAAADAAEALPGGVPGM